MFQFFFSQFTNPLKFKENKKNYYILGIFFSQKGSNFFSNLGIIFFKPLLLTSLIKGKNSIKIFLLLVKFNQSSFFISFHIFFLRNFNFLIYKL